MVHITIGLGFGSSYAGARWEASDRSRGMHDHDEREESKAPEIDISDTRDEAGVGFACDYTGKNEAESNRIEIRYQSRFEYFYKSPLGVILLN
jgi:hypothetical protein